MAKIEIKNSAGSLLAVFDQEYISGALGLEENQDAVKDPWIERKLNGSCTLTFRVPVTSGKVQYLTDENYIHADGRKFVIIDPQGEGLKLVREKGQLWMDVFARESWEELKYQHKTICNDTTQEPVKDLDVVITRSGTTAGGYAAGSAGSALSHLMPSTGWTLNSAGITGTHDLKTSQDNILGNIENIRDLWGGYHLWDSLAQTLDHQPESWSVDSGYEIRLGKNLKGLTKGYSFDFVTKLWVYGQNDVDILDVNVLNSGTAQAGGTNTITLAAGASSVNEAYTGGWIYLTGGTGSGQYKRISAYNGSTRVATLESNWTTQPVGGSTTYELKARFLLNFGHRSVIRSDVWRNQDETDPTSLKMRAQDVHAKVAYPRYWYRVEHVDLRSISEYSHESFSVGQLIDIIDETLGIAVSVRVTRHKYNVFRPWMCDLDLGDTVFELKQILADLEKQKRVNYRQARTAGTAIVADGSTTKNTRRADFIVPPGSTSAEDIINQTINFLSFNGGKVVLLDGSYIIDGQILLISNITLDGQGSNTVIKVKDNLPVNMYDGIVYAYQKSNVNVTNLRLEGNKSANTRSIRGVRFNQTSMSSIKGIWANNFSDIGIDLINCSNCIVMSNFCENNDDYGIVVWTLGMLSDNISVIGNVLKGNNFAILLMGEGSNYVRNATVTGNIAESNWSGIRCTLVLYSTITSNICRKNNGPGMEVYTSSHNVIANNSCSENSQSANNTYDNIIIGSNSDYNNVQSNTCRKGSLTNKPRYGIRIDSSDCNNNIITNNDLYDSGVTASFSDAGTSTITTAGNRL